MGNPDRCPKCNRFGTSELNGYCKNCFDDLRANRSEERFYNLISKYMNISHRIAKGALLEIGCKAPREVKPEDRDRVINIIKRRLPNNRRKRGLVARQSPLSTYSRLYRNDPKSYNIEKERVNLEHD